MPFAVPSTVTPAVRVEMLDLLSTEGLKDPQTQALARHLDGVYQRSRATQPGGKARAPRDATGQTPKDGPETPTDRVQFLMGCIEDLITYDDGPDYEMFQTVPETLFGVRGEGISRLTGRPRGSGRCSHRTAVFDALARLWGFNAKARWFQQDGAARNHVAALVCDGGTARVHLGGCFIAEVTVPDAILGESPYQALARSHAHTARVGL